MTPPRNLTISQAAARMRSGELTAEALVLSCLERIETREPVIRAWVYLDREPALKAARRMDEDAKEGRWHGPLHGIPIGIKDIIDVEGMPTTAGCEAVYDAPLPPQDAACVKRLREAGAILLGKSVTTAFAFLDPPPTKNPWNTAHTPGGSSSGSGAAVADRMCIAALGTQTGGSTLRPAAFNGLAGFKAGLHSISTEGVVPLSWQLDHVGVLARCMEDAHLLWQVMRREHAPDWASMPQGQISPLRPEPPYKIWRMRGFFETACEPEMLAALHRACGLLEQNGAEIVEMPLPESFSTSDETCWTIIAAEAAAYHRDRFAQRKAHYPHHLGEAVQKGLDMKASAYIEARGNRKRMRQEISRQLEQVDAAIMPTTPGAAGDTSTIGSNLFNAPWSICGLPAISLPAGLAEGNLPLGLQLAAADGGEDQLLQIGAWCESLLRFHGAPE